MFQGKAKPKLSPENYILVSDDEILRENLEKQFQKKVELQKAIQLFSKNTRTEIIFDQNYLNFKAIIQALEENKNNNFTFKILPKLTDFIIGSNSSFDRGEIIKISD